ncbi:tetratricopeptide repeat protein, partial [Desulfolutivibrio sp.]|uniref:tetratricopeptide repeat protein n=1 Tax=Desulfolutivibrio sp. TaxID=2773296 RepID=UPI002F96A8DF
MRRLFFCIALAAGMLGLWGWDAGVVAAQKPPVATDTETAAKLDKLQWRLDELERKEREYLGLRERDQKEMEKRLREFESGVKQEAEKETQNAKELVENKIKYFDLWLAFISIIATIAAASIPITYRLLMRKIRKSERIASESLAKVVDIHEKAQNKYHDIQQVTENANILFGELKIATRDAKIQLDETRIATKTATILLEETQTAIHSAKQLLDDLKVEKEKLSSLLVTQTNPSAASSPSSRRAAKIASEQDEDTYSKFAGEALLAQEKGDYSAALKAWEEASRIDPNAAQAYFGIGYVKHMLADNAKNTEKFKLLNEAIEAYSKTISLAPDSSASYNNLGSALAELAAPDLTPEPEKRR